MEPTMSAEEMALTLAKEDDYRVLRRFKAQDRYGNAQTDGKASVTFIDAETTGVEAADVPIEIGAVRVEYDTMTGELGRVLERFEGMQDPGRPLPEHIVELTGITDKDLQGKRFDEEGLKGVAKRSSIIVSHNAGFDRVMVEKLFPWMANRPWGCTLVDVPWRQSGVASSKLEFIAQTRGIFYGAHRALEDAEVCAAVAGLPLVDGKPAFAWVLDQARAEWFRIWATDAPFEAKGKLKSNGYEWCDGSKGAKGWRTLTRDPQAETEFLAREVYGFRGRALMHTLSKHDRFSERYQDETWISMGR